MPWDDRFKLQVDILDTKPNEIVKEFANDHAPIIPEILISSSVLSEEMNTVKNVWLFHTYWLYKTTHTFYIFKIAVFQVSV